VYYLRMHNGGGTGMPAWPNAARYSVNVDGYAGGPPWVMGGFDLTPPSPAIVKAYHERGVLRDMNMSSLTDLYRGEGFVFTPGPQGRTDGEALNPVWYRHVVEGGRVLFAPPPGTYLYQRLTRTNHGAYELRGAVLRSIIQPPPAGRGQP